MTGANVEECFLTPARIVMMNIQTDVYDLSNDVMNMQSCGIKVTHPISKGRQNYQTLSRESKKKSCAC